MAKDRLFSRKKLQSPDREIQPAGSSFLRAYSAYIYRVLVALFLVSGCLVLLDYWQPRAWVALKSAGQEKLNNSTKGLKTYLSGFFSSKTIESYFQGKTRFQDLSEQVELLKLENLKLRSDQQDLQEALRYQETTSLKRVLAKVVAFPGRPYRESILLNKGHLDGIAKDDPIVIQGSIVGRILKTTAHFSYGLLISDPNFRIPARIAELKEDGIVSGRGKKTLKIRYLEGPETVQPGMKVVSSGIGGLYPPGYLIGLVEAVKEDEITLRPMIQMKRLSFVEVIKVSELLESFESIQDDLI